MRAPTHTLAVSRRSLAALVAASLLVASCNNESVMPYAAPSYNGGARYQRYVAIGNSITAGFQSGGINDSTQQRSYAVLLAQAMGGDPFYYPSLTKPGCPPPYSNVYTRVRTSGDTVSTTCLFRAGTPPYLSNVAVPGATTFDPIHPGPTVSSNSLSLLILGGRSQVEAMADARPTFVSVWIGNNDVLGSATNSSNAGNPALITPVALFQAHYDSMLAAIDGVSSIQGGVLLGVADVATIPFLSYGHIYLGAKVAGQLPAQMTVSPNCAPRSSGGIGDTVLVPFPYGFTLIAMAQAGAPVTLDCTDDHNIEPAELANLHATVAGYNTFISSRATSRGWAYFDPNPALLALRADTTAIRIFPNPAATTCTGVYPAGAPFGTAFSCDGVHPSSSTHHLIAQSLQQVINAKYGSAIPVP